MENIISKKDVEHVAKLSRLKLKEEEKQKLTQQLNSILEYMKKLNKLDISKTEPTSHVIPLENVKRKDVKKPSYPVEEVLQNAPDKERGYFKVPPIIE
jgi:aspartyl-tRNA(Asn)/glutamyl-tRNA(Gln) amidotransferase subunit C